MTVMKRSTRAGNDNNLIKTVEEHFKVLISDEEYIHSIHKKVTPDDLPDWFDEELFKQGQNYYKKNLLGINTGYMIGFIAAFLIPSIAKTLASTNQSSTPCTAFKRYLQTILHTYNMHLCDITDPESNFYKSLNVIRWKHSTNSKRLLKLKQEGIWQKDMVLTQYGFVSYVLMNPQVLGLTNEPEGRQGFNHLWRVIGHMLGIHDRLNLCRGNEQETTILCKKLLKEVFQEKLKTPTDEFYTLMHAAVEGLGYLDPLLDLDSFLYFFHEINGSKYEKKISLYSRMIYLYKKAILYLMGIPVIGSIVRSSWNVLFRTNIWIHENYPIRAWLKFGKHHTKIQLYPQSAF